MALTRGIMPSDTPTKVEVDAVGFGTMPLAVDVSEAEELAVSESPLEIP